MITGTPGWLSYAIPCCEFEPHTGHRERKEGKKKGRKEGGREGKEKRKKKRGRKEGRSEQFLILAFGSGYNNI